MNVRWIVEIGDEFEPELESFPEQVRTGILALAMLLQAFGPPSRGYVERFPARQHEGATIQRGGRRVESSFCFRPGSKERLS